MTVFRGSIVFTSQKGVSLSLYLCMFIISVESILIKSFFNENLVLKDLVTMFKFKHQRYSCKERKRHKKIKYTMKLEKLTFTYPDFLLPVSHPDSIACGSCHFDRCNSFRITCLSISYCNFPNSFSLTETPHHVLFPAIFEYKCLLNEFLWHVIVKYAWLEWNVL